MQNTMLHVLTFIAKDEGNTDICHMHQTKSSAGIKIVILVGEKNQV